MRHDRRSRANRFAGRRKRAADALGGQEESYRLLVESVKDYAIFMLDPAGNIASWNDGARQLKGYEPEEVIGRHFSLFYMPEDIARGHPANELEWAKRDGRYEEEGWRIVKDGHMIWANVVITALRGKDGGLRGFAKVTRDMTERRRSEEQLREARAQLERRTLNAQHAMQINDNVVQRLTIARYARDVHGPEAADAALDDALRHSKQVISEMLAEADISPGELRRT
jgi:PAS domain S-box-containing protein